MSVENDEVRAQRVLTPTQKWEKCEVKDLFNTKRLFWVIVDNGWLKYQNLPDAVYPLLNDFGIEVWSRSQPATIPQWHFLWNMQGSPGLFIGPGPVLLRARIVDYPAAERRALAAQQGPQQ
ncbi:hypothetical protein AURDEDRAFT_131818 [Auricularia subglabra TFB-10046 SS5]|uniref:Uncharacterized protein n=1 Tax=Auricularia subglabra (strain TFB-10046 / SS5) TaxID=717982 RepID=J0CSC6_AURST|nr:hypothetical protein AURDEDRAFT_131818 [Auricularia subglabra TFB-10046 SS5]